MGMSSVEMQLSDTCNWQSAAPSTSVEVYLMRLRCVYAALPLMFRSGSGKN